MKNKTYAKIKNKNDKVGVIGIGGLGHLAIKFLKAVDCDVTAFSSSPEKKMKYF